MRIARVNPLLMRHVHNTRILKLLDERKYVAAIFCDLSRAFDSIDHSVLIQKLYSYGVRGGFLDFLRSFLKDRIQVVSVDGGDTLSDRRRLSDCAVPQGSCIGNILFLVMVNDLIHLFKSGDFIMFADDGCAIVNGVTFKELKINVLKTIELLTRWFQANGLNMNLNKTNIIHFWLRGTYKMKLNITYDNINIPQVDRVNFLGFYFDAGLKWNSHIDELMNKLAKACFALSRLAQTLTPESLRMAYYAYVNSLLAYGVDLWGQAAERNRVFIMQKRTVRVLANISPLSSVRESFKELKILTLPCVYILEVCKYMWHNLHGFEGSAASRRPFTLKSIPCRLSKTSRALPVVGVKIYNKLDNAIKDSISYEGFIGKVKAFLMERAYYNLDDFLNDK